ncbi:helix-turn-helix domain-containing protein [Brevibacillus agri]|uniref:helix-turn-helix domain-containing protein n=1 Tax=Brevibacillus TaxID=55080 RepID=UPI001562E871|nr:MULTISPECIES: helix-turn-helix domain-containing protein [Brevibacillus]MBE5394534.1 helix-turn-helix domain-containing protein [Brevibacillus borstelensis]MED1646026.1 helix-turn-helix domain-containing protein [Brevibacillus agri]MED1656339.1 helix-turn-helix domain-containing protein [Brevibacillus agri]MED1689261.1 helix-turn-helix domain-containing protein [Brevibacillus agri]MED1693784.1 helix-turn-helix domain-containing protein [Brevibacillus agri]
MSVKQSKKRFSVRVDHNLLEKCARNRELTKKAYRVLLYLLTKADSKEFTEISQKVIADEIGMDKTSVSLALKNLKEEGIIEHFPYSQNIMFIDIDDEDDEFD